MFPSCAGRLVPSLVRLPLYYLPYGTRASGEPESPVYFESGYVDILVWDSAWWCSVRAVLFSLASEERKSTVLEPLQARCFVRFPVPSRSAHEALFCLPPILHSGCLLLQFVLPERGRAKIYLSGKSSRW